MNFTYCKIIDETGVTVFSSESPIEVFFAGVAKKYFNVPDADLKVVARIGVDMYLKADEIDLGRLADFVSEHYKDLENKPVREQLNEYHEHTGLGGY